MQVVRVAKITGGGVPFSIKIATENDRVGGSVFKFVKGIRDFGYNLDSFIFITREVCVNKDNAFFTEGYGDRKNNNVISNHDTAPFPVLGD